MEYSTLQLNARDIDEKKGIVSFYFADFNSVDSHGRRMNKNAFNRTFNNNFKRMVHLFNHNENAIIGKPMEVNKDEKGAYMVSKLVGTERGKEVLQLYSEGVLNEHSFGFIIKNSDQDGNVEVVNELQMFEASTVTWGANENTPVISLNELNQRVTNLEGLDKKLDEILNRIALLPVTEHQDSQVKDDIDLIKFINDYN